MFSNSKNSDATLNAAIAALRSQAQSTDPVLTDSCRATILDNALNPQISLKPETALFLPMRRWVLAGVLPVMAVVAVVAVAPFVHLGQTASVPGSLTVSKHDGDVVFTLANGKRQHTITRSTVPNRFDPASAVRMKDGSFVDNAGDGAGLVFYRID